MGAKRALDFSNVTDMNVNKRLKRVERLARHSKPEMKHQTFNISATSTAGSMLVFGLTGIANGDLVVNRTGDKIRVWRIEIRGLASGALDQFIVQAHGSDAPAIGDFTNTGGGSPTFRSGGYINDDNLNTRFTEWKHYRNLYANNASDADSCKMVLRFKNGIIIKYQGTNTPPVDNGLYYCVGNGTATTFTTRLIARVWFTDA